MEVMEEQSKVRLQTEHPSYMLRPQKFAVEPHADASGFWHKLTFGFINGLLLRASKSADLGPRDAAALLPPSDEAHRLAQQFDSAYAGAGASQGQPGVPGSPWTTPLFLTLLRLHWRAMLWQQLLCTGEVAQALVTPVLLREFLRWLEAATQGPDGSGDGGPPPVWRGWVFAVALGLSGISIPLMMHHHNWSGVRMALCMRQQAISAIHSKILRMTASPGAAATTTTGGGSSSVSAGYVSTLIGADVRRFDDALKQWPYLVASPLQLIAVIVMVGLELDFVSAVAGASVSIALIPLQAALAGYISELRGARARCTDERVRLMAEVVDGHLAVKMCGLEDSFQVRIKKLRKAEERQVRRASRIRAFNLALYTSISSIIAFVTFSVHRARGGSLNVASVFYALSLLQLPAAYLVYDFVTAAQYATELGVSITRIQAFLSLPEPPPPQSLAPLASTSSAAAAGLEAAPRSPSPPRSSELHAPPAASQSGAAKPLGPSPPRLEPPPLAARALPSLPDVGRGGHVAMHGGDFDWRCPLGRQDLEPSAEVLQLLAAAPEDDDEYGGITVVAVEAAAPVVVRGTAEGLGKSTGGVEATDAAAEGGRGWCGPCCPARVTRADVSTTPTVTIKVVSDPAPVSATLSGVRFSCAPSELLGVCGATGSGKSTLLAALLGQLQPLQQQHAEEGTGDGGGVQLRGSVAYCAQVPWIMAGSVRDNITFGLPYEQEWYDAVVSACCLPEDLARMAAGDLTELGEGGAGLSGGQKARVALARACYCRPDVALLDDPLSAVDARVGLQLFERVLGPAGLMAVRCGTTRLLVTHQEQFLPLCDRVLLLRGGRQAALGPWSEVQQLRREPLALAPAAGASAAAESAVSTPVTVGTATADAAVDSGADGEGTDSPTLVLQPGWPGGGGTAGAARPASALLSPSQHATVTLQPQLLHLRPSVAAEAAEAALATNSSKAPAVCHAASTAASECNADAEPSGVAETPVAVADTPAGGSGAVCESSCSGRSEWAVVVATPSRPGSTAQSLAGSPQSSTTSRSRDGRPPRPPAGGLGTGQLPSRFRIMAMAATPNDDGALERAGGRYSIPGSVTSAEARRAVDAGMPAVAHALAPPRRRLSAGAAASAFESKAADSHSAPNSPHPRRKAPQSLSTRLRKSLTGGTAGGANDSSGEQRGSMGRARTVIAGWVGTGGRLTMWGGGGGGGDRGAPDPAGSDADDESLKRPPAGASLLASEDKETGAVSWSVYGRYVRCLGLGLTAVVLLALLAGEAAYLAADWWLALWAAEEPAQQAEPRWQITYAILTAVVVLLAVARFVIFFEASVSAATGLHNKMLKRVLRAPLSFFHSNPAGRIINRFSKDQGLVDDLLPAALGEVLDSGMLVVGALVLVAVAVPLVLPLFIPLAVAFLFVRRRYITASREVRRWEAVTYSPIYTFVAATCKGLPTIRAYGAGERFQQELLRLLSLSAEWSFASNAGASWISLRLDTISAVTLLLAAVMAVLVRDRINVEVLALALTHSLSLTHMMQFFVQQSAEVENHMTSVERLLAYTELDSEPPRVAEGGGQPPAGWPRTGALHFQDVSAAYQPGLPPVLRGVTFSVPAGSSCGVVGRTGSGKSSLLLTLFRMVELTHGSILLDGVDIAAVGLDALRRHLAVIPQDPVLFGGSLRINLDPWGAHSSNDAELWAVLRSVRLAGAVSALPGGLDAQVAAGGANLSAGQRQLLCLARAMLQRAKVLALDEATANVDAETDEAVQAALRESLQGACAVGGGAESDGGGIGSGGGGVALVIAHRLDTVMDLDALLVLAEGRVEEWGPPRQLLRGGGSLWHMAAAAAESPSVGNGRTEAEAVVTQGAQGAGKMVRSLSDAGWRA